MHTSHAKGVRSQDEGLTRQICYLSQGADPPVDVSGVLREAIKLSSEFPTFVPKLLGLKLPRRAAKLTVLGLVGSVHCHVGTQVHYLALNVLFSPLADSRRNFQLVCSQQTLPPHLIDTAGRVILDTCPQTSLLETVRWFVFAVERFLITSTSTQLTSQAAKQMSMGDIWTSAGLYRELCLIANQQCNALTTELGERQRAVVEELGSTRRRGDILASAATRLAKDMSVALELISGGCNEHETAEIAENSHSATGSSQYEQPEKARESDLRAIEVARLLADLSAVDDTILNIIDVPPAQNIPAVTSAMLRSVRDALGDLTEKALSLRYAVYSLSQDMSGGQDNG